MLQSVLGELAQQLRRERLVAQLEAAVERPLTLVAAPAGYGKTLAVDHFVERTSFRVVRVRAEAHEDRRSGWTKVAAALRAGGIEPASTVDLPELGASAEAEQALLLKLVDDMTRLAAPTLVVIEDADLPTDPALFRQLTFLVNRLPDEMRLLAISRAHLPLPIGRWRGLGLVAEIGEDDLRATDDEAADLLDLLGLHHLSPDQVAALNRRAEGWPIGLVLLAGSFLRESPAHPFDEELAARLAEELLRRYPPELQQFVLGTSILARLQDDLCRAVTADESSGRLLQTAEAANLFLVAMDDTREWFRYRRLFAEVMRWELDRRHPGVAHRLHQRAARWYEGHGFVSQAVRHLVAAGEPEDALRLVMADAYRPWQEGSVLGTDWESLFPAAWLAEDPGRMLRLAMVLGQYGWLAEARLWLDRAEELLARRPADDPAQTLLVAARALWHGVHLDAAPAIELAERALPALAGDPRHDMLRRLLLVAVTNARLVLDDVDGAERDVDAVEAISPMPTMHDLIIPALRARIALRRGELRQAEALGSVALQTAATIGLASERAVRDAHLAVAGVLAERGDMKEAEALICGARDGAARHGWPVVAASHRLVLAPIRAALGGAAAGFAELDAARAELRGLPAGPEVTFGLDLVEARIRVFTGDLDRVAEILAQAPPGIAVAQLRVRLALARRDPDTAADLLRGIEPVMLRDRIRHHLLGARIAALQGRDRCCDDELLAAAHLAQPEDYRLTLVGDAFELLPRLRNLGAREPSLRGWIASVEALIGELMSTDLNTPLSDRELAVLRLLQSDLRQAEIAAELEISVNTLKSHTRSLYRKLGVNARADAVANAQQAGLL